MATLMFSSSGLIVKSVPRFPSAPALATPDNSRLHVSPSPLSTWQPVSAPECKHHNSVQPLHPSSSLPCSHWIGLDDIKAHSLATLLFTWLEHGLAIKVNRGTPQRSIPLSAMLPSPTAFALALQLVGYDGRHLIFQMVCTVFNQCIALFQSTSSGVQKELKGMKQTIRYINSWPNYNK
ncbi:hypothetical protein LY78DRAFT_207660 [Colletotrichum sublineola]|nr:hypothetical protein LY78DRAFT_207660 [Colletotrichum sublineola]